MGGERIVVRMPNHFRGPVFGYLFVFGSLAMVLRGWKPGWFAVHHLRQPIAGVPYRRSESVTVWAVACVASLALAWTATVIHHRAAPEHPDLNATILDQIEKLQKIWSKSNRMFYLRHLLSLSRHQPRFRICAKTPVVLNTENVNNFQVLAHWFSEWYSDSLPG